MRYASIFVVLVAILSASCEPQEITGVSKSSLKGARAPGPGAGLPTYICSGESAHFISSDINALSWYSNGFNAGQGLRGTPFTQKQIRNTGAGANPYVADRFTSTYELPLYGVSKDDSLLITSGQKVGGYFYATGTVTAYVPSDPSYWRFVQQRMNDFGDQNSPNAVAYGLGLIDGMDNVLANRGCVVANTFRCWSEYGTNFCDNVRTVITFPYNTNPGEDPW